MLGKPAASHHFEELMKRTKFTVKLFYFGDGGACLKLTSDNKIELNEFYSKERNHLIPDLVEVFSHPNNRHKQKEFVWNLGYGINLPTELFHTRFVPWCSKCYSLNRPPNAKDLNSLDKKNLEEYRFCTPGYCKGSIQ